MPGLAVVAATATGVQPPYALFMGGTDVLKDRAGALYGVPLESIEVVEQGPGRVSSMTFRVEDPTKVVTVPAAGDEVRLLDLVNNIPHFGGFVDHVAVRPHENGSGRWIEVVCVGYEVLLDWAIVATLAVDNSQLTGTWWQAAAGAARLSNIALQQGAPLQGTQATPIASEVDGFAVSAATFTLQTLREVLRNIWSLTGSTGLQQQPAGVLVTVDFYRGLRIWSAKGVAPDDYATLVINDTVAGPLNAGSLSYAFEPGEIVRTVYVNGSSVFGPFSDGSGKDGAVAAITDSTVTTLSRAQLVASAYLAAVAGAVRGSFELLGFNPAANNYRAGSLVQITDASVDLAAAPFAITSIERRYHGNGTQDWTVSFGGPPPSSMALLRRLTRDKLS